MVKARLGMGLAASCLLVCSMASSLQAAPEVAQILQYEPKLKGVDCDTPTAAEQANCEVKLVRGTAPGSSGWLLVDKSNNNRPLRRFFDSDGDRKIDIYSYYKNGLEVYREIDTNSNNKPDQFRWLNSGGMKWGIDANEDGKIDSWRAISAEEVAEEAFHAMMTRDYDRLKILFVTDGELKTLGLPENYQERIRAMLEQAPKRFQEVAAKLAPAKLDKTSIRVESAVPQCVPGESIGMSKDLFRYPTRTVLYPTGEDKFELLNTGEMLQVGQVWRLLDVPSTNATTPGPNDPAPGVVTNKEAQKIMEELAKHDPLMPTEVNPGPDAKASAWHMKRVGYIDQLLPLLTDEAQKTSFLKQKGDNLSQAAIHAAKGDTKALDMLRQLKEKVVAENPKSKMAGYMTYRLLWAEYMPKLVSPDTADLAAAQKEWTEKLNGFVSAYPKADDTPDALYQLAMSSEFTGKEDDAKRYYKQLADDFPEHPMAPKARGAIRRLGLVGNTFELNGKTLNGKDFSMITQRGKVVLVYYWASYCTACADSFAKLKKLHGDYNAKGFEIVTVNLDDTAEQAQSFLTSHPLPGHHLFVPGKHGGMTSPLAEQYGIMGLPTAFLVGSDGNVINRSVQINDLEEAVKKALK